MPTKAYDAMLGQCPRATVEAPDDDLFGQTIPPALDHIQYILVAHSCAKETSQVCTATGESLALGEATTWPQRRGNMCTFSSGPCIRLYREARRPSSTSFMLAEQRGTC